MMKMGQKKFLGWLAVILWLGVIYYFSAQPDLRSGLEMAWDLVFRKIAHIAEYFVLAYLIFQALKQYNLPFHKILIGVVILSFLIAILDEYHQTFIVDRQGKILDVFIDWAGVLLMIGLLVKEKKVHFIKFYQK